MLARNLFTEKEIPYEKFEKMGITRDDFLLMPKEVLGPLINGRVTPLIQGHFIADNGKVIDLPMKIQLARDSQNRVQLYTYPMRKEVENSLHLTPGEMERVKNGDVIRKEVKDVDGIRRQKYLQMDPETKSLIRRDVAALQVREQLREFEKVKDIELGANQKQAAVEGKPVELTVGDQKVSVGLDLREPQGFKIVNGDMEEWKRQMEYRYDDAHEGFMGYVKTDENRWEYQMIVDRLSHKEEKKEEKRSSGLKL